MLDEFLGGSEVGRGGKGRVLRGVEASADGSLDGSRRGLILFREVNELNRTPEASTL